jgi:hypothetical protein
MVTLSALQTAGAAIAQVISRNAGLRPLPCNLRPQLSFRVSRNIGIVSSMSRNWPFVVGLLLCTAPFADASPALDTSLLAAHFSALGGKLWLTNDEYRAIQSEYLAWIDSRLKSGVNWQSMNRELESVGLIPRGPKNSDPAKEMDTSYTRYVEPISVRSVRSGNDLLIIVAGMFKGNGCSLDVTAVVYQLKPPKRLAILNAEPGESQYAFYLSGLAVSDVATDERLFASGWVASNCSSTWNGKRVRIDRRKNSVVRGVLVRNLAAKDSDEGESISAQVERDVVTFRYNGAIGDGDLLSGPAVARYRIVGDRAVPALPVALTRAGFLHEWMEMSDSEAAGLSEPEALAVRRSVASILRNGFQWQRIGACGGSPPVWEIAFRPHDSQILQVLRIAGSRASELRMLAVSNTVTQSCLARDLSQGLTDVAAELPW